MRREFTDLLDEVFQPHLVVGYVEAGAVLVPAEVEIGRLIEILSPKADWATGLVRDKHGLSVHCVFARESDAHQLATAVKAKEVGHHPGVGTRSEFQLDRTTRKAIAMALSDIYKP